MPTKTQNTETAQYIADELIYDSKHPKFANKVFLLVEDRSDQDVFFSKFNKDIVVFRPIKGCGRTNVGDKFDAIIEKLNTNGIVNFAIKDSDFNRVLNIHPKFDNLFYTDCHDVEMMCFHSKETLTEIFECFSQIFDIAFINQIFKDLELLSKFKCLNIHKDCGYKFEGFKLLGENKKIKTNILSNYSLLEEEIKKISTKGLSITISQKDIDSFFKTYSCFDLEYEITNGHDFIAIFCFYFSSLSSIKDFCEKHLRTAMCACFRMEHFVRTQLYQDISSWAASHSLGNIFA
ncbi:MAG: hypothetical protein II852_13150 [Bacteroidales bacterium]|nr:hypothetical protein [Bacteroidales bacterium]